MTEVVEAEEAQGGKEDLIKDMDQVEEQEEDLIKDMDQIEEQKEDLIEDMDLIEEQGKDQIEDMDQAEEQEEEVNTDKLIEGIAVFARSEDTIHYYIVRNSQNTFPEVVM